MKDNIRVAWLDEHLLYWSGGVKWALEICKRVNQRCELRIFVTKASEENKRLFSKNNIKIEEISDVSIDDKRYWFLYPYYLWRNFNRLKCLLKSYDVIISTSPIMSFIASLLSCKTIFVFFEPNPWIYSSDFVKGLPLVLRAVLWIGHPLIKFIDWLVMRGSDCLVTLDYYRAKEGRRIYGKQSNVVALGVDLDIFSKKSDPDLERRYSDKTIIMHVATYLTPMKGTKFIVQAMPSIIKDVPNCHLLILNPQNQREERDQIVTLARNLGVESHVEFVDKLDEEVLPYYYSISQIVVQPSFYISAYTSFVEGGACGVPSIAFDGINADEVIVDGETGFLVPSGDVNMLAKRIVELSLNFNLCNQMGVRARERVSNLFSWDRGAERMLGLINRLSME
jgi:glycosyltransferase involved in cell wall biosynthesis